MFLDNEINKLFNNMKKRTSFINIFIFGQELNSNQKKKKNTCWAWAGLSLVLYLGGLLAIRQWFSVGDFVNLETFNISELLKLLLFSFFIIVILWFINKYLLNIIATIYIVSTNVMKL